jgi:hypothetical protein
MATLVSACSPAAGSASTVASGLSPPDSVAASASASHPQRVPLPRGFPVLPGAVPVGLPSDDAGLIGLWTTDLLGSAAYDFYVKALPAAGYRIVAVYPGGAAAVIRFSLPDGAIWQVVTRAGPRESVAIEVRLDRP